MDVIAEGGSKDGRNNENEPLSEHRVGNSEQKPFKKTKNMSSGKKNL